MELRKAEPSLLALTHRHLCMSFIFSMWAALLPFLNFLMHRSRLLCRASATHISVPWNSEEQGSSLLCNHCVLNSKSRHKQCFMFDNVLLAELLPTVHSNNSGTKCPYQGCSYSLLANSTVALKMQASTVTCCWCDKHGLEIKFKTRKGFNGCESRVKFK